MKRSKSYWSPCPFKFKARVVIEDEVLSEEELNSVNGSDSLIQIRGRWVQINQKN